MTHSESLTLTTLPTHVVSAWPGKDRGCYLWESISDRPHRGLRSRTVLLGRRRFFL